MDCDVREGCERCYLESWVGAVHIGEGYKLTTGARRNALVFVQSHAGRPGTMMVASVHFPAE